MPDPAPSRRRYRPGEGPAPAEKEGALESTAPYAELHCKTNFSFLRGASHPDELVRQAAQLGYQALAITDRHSLAGVVQAHCAARDLGLKLLIGAELHPLDAPPVVVWAMDRAGYGRLSRLLTRGLRRAPKGECHLTLDDVAEHASGLLAGVWLASPLDPAHRWLGDECLPLRAVPPEDDAERRGPTLWPGATLAPPWRWVARYREIFGDRAHLLAELHHGAADPQRLARLAQLGRKARVPLAAAGDVHYHVPERAPLADVLTAIRLGTTVLEAGERLFANAERHLHCRGEIQARFAALPSAHEQTLWVAERCRFSLAELRYEYPEELCPRGTTPLAHLAGLCWAGAAERYPGGIPTGVRRLIEHELKLIEELRYEAYFLTVWDLVRFARSRNILCQGRGSAANSAVCFALGITSVDPDRIDVLFERFVSRERDEAPDIDVDFEHERREEVLQYLYDKYGRERAGMTAEVITYRPRSAVRDVGKALGLSLERVDSLAKALDSPRHEARLAERAREAGLSPESTLVRQLLHFVETLQGFPRHLSQHVGGMVITRGPLCELVPIENAAMPERTVIQWDKNDLDDLGLLKVDCLALGMLTALHKAMDLVARHAGRSLSLATIEPEDPAVYEMIGRADTVGVFQIESRAQMSMLPRLLPRTFYDLVIEVAIVRPGPIQGNMVHPYLRRRAGLETVEYPSEAIREVLHKTLGVPIFQEQAMRLAVVAAGFTPGEADQLRRAMGAWRRPGVIEQFRQRLVQGMLERGLTEEFAERVFLQIRGFGEYGFPESHAASFALLVYASAWLKRYYPAAFTAALLNSQPMGFYAPAQLVRDAQAHGVEIRPVDVNQSGWDATLEPRGPGGASPSAAPATPASPWSLRLGLRQVRGLGRQPAAQIEQARADLGRPFRSLDELARTTRLGRAVLTRLAQADALGSLGLDRRRGLWQAIGQEPVRPLFAQLSEPDADDPAEAIGLPPLSKGQEVVSDYRTQGLSLRAHPLSLVRPRLQELKIVTAAQLATLPPGGRVRVAGLVLMRQRPSTARGITFVTLEDETGQANLIVRAAVWERHHHAARGAHTLLAQGRLERQGQVIHILVERLEDLSGLLAGVAPHSRDFH